MKTKHRWTNVDPSFQTAIDMFTDRIREIKVCKCCNMVRIRQRFTTTPRSGLVYSFYKNGGIVANLPTLTNSPPCVIEV